MRTIIILLLPLLILSSCCTYEENKQKTYIKFKECLQLIPKGPQSTVYNDWDEVIQKCYAIASNNSIEWTCN